MDVGEVLVDAEHEVAWPLACEARGAVWQAVPQAVDVVVEVVEELVVRVCVPVAWGAGAVEGGEEVLEDA